MPVAAMASCSFSGASLPSPRCPRRCAIERSVARRRSRRSIASSPPQVVVAATSSSKPDVGFHVARMRASTDPKPERLPASALTVREALSDEELKAAAALRAKSFYVYPPEREFAGKIHQAIKAGEEFDALVARREAMEREAARAASEGAGGGGEQQPRERAAALVALFPASELAAESSSSGGGSSLRSSLESDQDLLLSSSGMVLVGTLDLVAARAVEGEVLLGGGKAPAYLANVCVAPSGRRRGVGAALLARARALARAWECDGLFVHALAVNEVAERFYSRAGFVVESEEGAAEAARRGHCLDGVEGLGRSVLYRDATFLL